MAIQRLTAAYRSRSRPSSTLGAKASTMCPYYLDGDLVGRGPKSSPGDTRFIGYCAVFKVREEVMYRSPSGNRGPPGAGGTPVSQNSTACDRARSRQGHERLGLPGPVDMSSDRMRSEPRTRGAPKSPRASASGIRCPRIGGLPRKEVIQPQLPLRLPCYDFTPVTSPTFDGSLPKGLGHRLRVLLTPMV